MMDEGTIELLEVGEEAVERAKKTLSKQPRFHDRRNGGKTDFTSDFYQQVYGWMKLAMNEIREERYQTDSRRRDQWLRQFWKLEPHWGGVINQSVLIDSSRPWTLVGGRNQVRLYANILHNANDGKGWRHYCRQAALSYRVTDIGSLTEIGRFGRNGPLRALFHLDSARCKWSGKIPRPLYYYPAKGTSQRWRENDFFNVCSLPNDDEAMHGLGWCATSRAFNLVKLLYGVLMHDQESVGARMMKGILLLNGIEEEQWEQAMQGRDAQLDTLARQYFGGVFILAGLGAGDVDAKLVSLSQLPAGFDRATFTDQIIFGYSLISGHDPREFWPVSSGQLGTAQETELQHRKSMQKGTFEFLHAWQERFQQELPGSLRFAFDERDTDAEVIEAQLSQAWADVVLALTASDSARGEGLLEPDQGLSILVEHGIIPPEWTEIQEAVKESDESGIATMNRNKHRERILSSTEIQRAIELFPTEPIIKYRWDGIRATERVLWATGDEARSVALRYCI